mmetsp:Transcript_18896/g.37143  ORF Transcript_18896/g.37143 Transcript_18896/m.37143 type:complete len:545 (-) Transcript_18896:300-1934(-)
MQREQQQREQQQRQQRAATSSNGSSNSISSQSFVALGQPWPAKTYNSFTRMVGLNEGEIGKQVIAEIETGVHMPEYFRPHADDDGEHSHEKLQHTGLQSLFAGNQPEATSHDSDEIKWSKLNGDIDGLLRADLGAQETPVSSKVSDSRNADACRRSRLKRKADIKDLKHRNAELERRREIYLERIAQLQVEVDALRHANCIDVAKENELLRAEIERHKNFISRIIHAMDEAPNMVPEERVRLLKTGIESAQSQVIGMLYTSTCWRPISPIKLNGGVEILFYYQFLPVNAAPHEIKRWNMRCEIYNINVPPAYLNSEAWKKCGDLETLRSLEKDRSSLDGVRRTIEPFLAPAFQEARDMLPGHLEAFQITEKHPLSKRLPSGVYPPDASVLRFWVAATMRENEVYPRSFICAEGSRSDCVKTISAEFSDQPIKCKITTYTEVGRALVSAGIVPSQKDVPNVRHLNSSALSGHIVIPSKQGASCHVISVGSVPIGTLGTIGKPENLVNHDGSLTKSCLEHLRFRTKLYWEDSIRVARLRAQDGVLQ